MRGGAVQPPESERDAIKRQIDHLESNLEQLRERLDELEPPAQKG
jgi:ubiquinone biosynthesis protein UbiJ